MSEIIGVQCPWGHDLYPRGIPRNKVGVTFQPIHDFMVVLPVQERLWVYGKDYEKKDPQPKHYKNGCFRLSKQQYGWLKLRCPTCATKSNLFQ